MIWLNRSLVHIRLKHEGYEIGKRARPQQVIGDRDSFSALELDRISLTI